MLPRAVAADDEKPPACYMPGLAHEHPESTDMALPHRSRRNQFAAKLALTAVMPAIAALLATLQPTMVRAEDVPDLSGVYGREAHNYPKPYMAPGRGGGVRDGYDNEYLRPWVVELLQRDALVARNGQAVSNPHANCYPESVPAVFGGAVMQILQTPTEVTMVFGDAGQFRTVYLNREHSKNVVPSYWGESVGRLEGDTLIVDTIGIAVNPQTGSMGNYGTPHSAALHLVEQWRFLRDGEVSTAPPPENDSFDAAAVIPGRKHMRLTFTLDDPVAFKKPWSVTLDYLPLNARVREYICAENSRDPQISPLLPTAEKPDF